MRAMVLRRPGERLAMEERPDPKPGPGQIRIRIEACGVCRTDLHVVDGELPNPKLPIVPGHEIVGRVEAAGEGVELKLGARVGVAWLGHTDGTCPYCRSGRENLCDAPLFTGYTRDGGYATHTIAEAAFVFPLADDLDPGRDRAPAVRRPDRLALAQNGRGRADDRHLRLRRRGPHHRPGLPLAGTARVRLHPARRRRRSGVRALDGGRMGGRIGRRSRPRRSTPPFCSRRSARSFPAALAAVRKGGRVVCGGIHMSDIPSFPYSPLVGGAQRRLGRQPDPRRRPRVSGARVRGEGRTTTTPYPLDKANEALDDLRSGRLEGAAVLVP